MNENLKMPASIEAEIAVIGFLLTDAVNVIDEVINQLTEDHFYTRNHAIVFKAMMDMAAKGQAIDLVTVTTFISALGKLEEIGGAHFISKTCTTFPFAMNLDSYIKILQDKFRLRRIIEISTEFITKSYNADDSIELLPDMEAQVFSLTSDTIPDDNRMEIGVTEVYSQLTAMDQGTRVTGLQTGIKTFDEGHGGLHKGRYIALGGRPSTGKTALVCQMALNITQTGKAVLFISIEMTEDRIIGRMASCMSEVSYQRFLHGHLSGEERSRFRRAVSLIKTLPIIITCPTDIDGVGIRSMIRKMKRKFNIELAIVDYIQLTSIPQRVDAKDAIAYTSKQIQKAGKETGVPIIVLSQLNREADRSVRPKMSNLKESGQIEQDADVIDLLWAEEDPTKLEAGHGLKVVLSMEKNKDGPRGDLEFYFWGETMKFGPRTTHS